MAVPTTKTNEKGGDKNSTWFREQDTRYKIQDTRYKIQDTRYKIQDTRYKIQDTRYKIQDTRYKIQDTRTKELETRKKVHHDCKRYVAHNKLMATKRYQAPGTRQYIEHKGTRNEY
ncbi:uncharacterized protein RJT20DRAFT_139892 [Scheffersomyces xylosifermentans]|uniref:uncharacterized protein n=1 Tax=Scheffersomyces xylosifermentans TaxID=1304137 RepID=UPI00315CE8FB